MQAKEIALREELVKGCKVLYAVGAAGDGLAGHLSARLDESRMLIKPRPVSWRVLAPHDLIVMDFHGRRVDTPSETIAVREWPIHAQIYRARADVSCVMHTHPAASTLMAALGIEVEPLNQDCAGFTGETPVLDNCGISISTVEFGDEVAGALGKKRVVLLKNHGTVVAGRSVAEVCVTAQRLERTAETMLLAASTGKVPVMSAEARAAVIAARKAAEGALREDTMGERWQMLQDYYLHGEES